MTAQSRDYLKSRFEAGDIPTAQDFIDLIDSFLVVDSDFVIHLNEMVIHDDSVVTLA